MADKAEDTEDTEERLAGEDCDAAEEDEEPVDSAGASSTAVKVNDVDPPAPGPAPSPAVPSSAAGSWKAGGV